MEKVEKVVLMADGSADIAVTITQNTFTGVEDGEVDVDASDLVETEIAAGDLTLNAAVENGNLDVIGGDGNDVIATGGGADIVFSGRGNDTIDAGAEADLIIGGAGADVMTGGAGDDTFGIAASDSGLTTATADIITDFVTASDMIDLATAGTTENFAKLDASTTVGDDIASVEAAVTAANGSALFDGTVQFLFVYDSAGGSDGYLVEDADLDGVADEAIQLNGLADATAFDFADII
jgi:Ca2+-binding RTX toxin-like protein